MAKKRRKACNKAAKSKWRNEIKKISSKSSNENGISKAASSENAMANVAGRAEGVRRGVNGSIIRKRQQALAKMAKKA